MEQDRQRCLEAGINQHLTKPVNPARLIQEINRWIAPEPVDAELLSALMIDLDALLATNSIAAEKHALQLRKELEGQGLDALLTILSRPSTSWTIPLRGLFLRR